ncbi:MAG: polysaccharide export protein [Flavobacteriales bacterium]|jgi:polysaccharide biosynthesis/export protein|nr:polysaccharide export protein [Flavobacteriales bacterium]
MKNFLVVIVVVFVLASCSTNSQLIYLKDTDSNNFNKVDYSNLRNNIEPGDILKIDVQTIFPEAALPYNIPILNSNFSNLQVLKLEGYLIDESMMINYPVLGELSVEDLSLDQLENKITQLLLEGGHLTNHIVKIKRLNSKFTVLGQVHNPGTFSNIDEKLNILQALGYAGDLTIEGKRKDITLIREKNGIRKIHKIDLTNSDFLSKAHYQIRNNDVIIVNPNYSKVKSAGFIGSSSSIASISSLLLSVTLLIINK